MMMFVSIFDISASTIASTTHAAVTGYDCVNNNPCTATGAALYYSYILPDKYISCAAGGYCYVMSCASGLVWDLARLVCVLPKK